MERKQCCQLAGSASVTRRGGVKSLGCGCRKIWVTSRPCLQVVCAPGLVTSGKATRLHRVRMGECQTFNLSNNERCLIECHAMPKLVCFHAVLGRLCCRDERGYAVGDRVGDDADRFALNGSSVNKNITSISNLRVSLTHFSASDWIDLSLLTGFNPDFIRIWGKSVIRSDCFRIRLCSNFNFSRRKIRIW